MHLGLVKESTSWEIKTLTLSGVAHARCQRQKRGMEDRRCEEPTMSKVVYCLRHGVRVLKKTGLAGALEGWKPRMDLLPLLPLLGIYEFSLAADDGWPSTCEPGFGGKIQIQLQAPLASEAARLFRVWVLKVRECADFTADVGDITRPCLHVLAQAGRSASSNNNLAFNCSSHGLCIKCSSARSSSSLDECR